MKTQESTSTIERVWELFFKINRIPRPSHHEEKIADYLCRFAEENGLNYERDAQNCVVIRKPASSGYEGHETIVLLNHMDMVCVSELNYEFNPLEDGVKAIEKDGWMSADRTSLGADNGIGLSIALAIMEDKTLEHGPLEMLTTTNEEDGMSGAANLSNDFIKGRKVINLDSEDYNTITIGAAGAYMQNCRWNFQYKQTTENLHYLKIEIKGGKGGHSGVDIHKGRGNAIKLLGELLYPYSKEIRIGNLKGGSSSAAIATEACATIGCRKDLKKDLEQAIPPLLHPYKDTDKGLTINIGYTRGIPTLDYTETKRLVETIHAIPNGVISMRTDMPNTVQTSSNIGILQQEEDTTLITTHTRSFSDDEMKRLGNNIADIMRQNEGTVRLTANSPAWEENSNSSLIELVSNTFEQELGFTPQKVAMHFVLEAGYFTSKYPGIEIACIGPRIVAPHSTKEQVEVRTVADILKVTKAILHKI